MRNERRHKPRNGRKKIPTKALLFFVVFLFACFFVFFLFSKREPSFNVYFLKGDEIKAVSRPLSKMDEILSKASFELLKGPNEKELEDGYFSEIPKGTQILSVKKGEDAVEINFNKKLEGYGGGSSRVIALVAQIVYTFTETANVDKVRIMIEGDQEIVLGGEGYIIDHPLSRDDIRF
ncbi:hypothetical protein A3J90_03335 [candidate division WOR-1 bacterium RIFOXYC2_FULL_37_10]|uniref:GerMN domain-containing protein n=1 Tax=candidate division WOR-1 bacterium RIFOXYB2_FULL_37_13 TaxID=1802579 RepID=A0A1F4SMV4_UNCSA|nr:MAG: hypothetical protein A2246_02420 [candidate division WOR-1 bacterium RIFOXYA2_FULL_37_7]OGC21023.1 MAG: hypothetical protein A2310_00700 [candidate division WOR-1 bacterium RIFOXYB2_FULL_37_13]OGC36779.1 MAG: hypothetical protein A3J90_03335 [candidate division WOR-1 bacterium RIFOXYC2_FULL_37_10]